MKTKYKIGQRVWYVECFAYSLPGNRSVCYYRPFRATIGQIQIKQHHTFRQRPHTHNTVKYLVWFDAKDRNKGYPQQNCYIFSNKQIALKYANLLNEMVDSYDKDDANKTMANTISKALKCVRNSEPVEENCYD